ncbi:MAG TPA: SAF domain-containing protein [Chloroflexia bacterium]|jgi:flagella basal body P-ring formation protein FlgA
MTTIRDPTQPPPPPAAPAMPTPQTTKPDGNVFSRLFRRGDKLPRWTKGLYDIGRGDREKLARLEEVYGTQFRNVEELWICIAEDPSLNIEEVAGEIGIDKATFLNFLVTDYTANRLPAKLKRHTLDIVVSVVVLVLALSAVNAFTHLSQPSSPLSVDLVVAARDLRAGTMLRSGDLSITNRVAGTSYFTATDDVRGLVLTRNINRGGAIQYQDVLRAQLIAAQDILSGTTIPSNSVVISWTTYLPNSIVDAKDAVNHQALRPIPNGQIIQQEFVR